MKTRSPKYQGYYPFSHPKSIVLMERVKDLDWELLDGYFDFQTGGDGDNGENMMYLLDIFFEEADFNPDKG